MKANKKIDCVKMKNDIQIQIYEEVIGMMFKEEVQHRQALIEKSEFGKLWKKLREKKTKKVA